MGDSDEAAAIRARCFTRLTPGQLLDTTMDRVPDSIALDTMGDGKVDKDGLDFGEFMTVRTLLLEPWICIALSLSLIPCSNPCVYRS